MDPVLISAIADLAWPILFVGLLYYVRIELKQLLQSGSEFAIEFMGSRLTVKPAKAISGRRINDETEPPQPELDLETGEKAIPADYVFLNHTSFLREDMQEDFQIRTGVPYPHFDIRVVVDSYYRGALSSIERVDYYLHEAYPEPIQTRTHKEDKFLLKELANGEYVIQAEVFFRGRKQPIILQRYLNLWTSGPRMEIQAG